MSCQAANVLAKVLLSPVLESVNLVSFYRQKMGSVRVGNLRYVIRMLDVIGGGCMGVNDEFGDNSKRSTSAS